MNAIQTSNNDSVSSSKNTLVNLDSIDAELNRLLVFLGLPTKGLLVPLRERSKMVNNIGSSLDLLHDQSKRKNASYISKMVAAATVGLFDAALNYLWDELISSLRNRVVSYDLVYFFDNVAGENSNYRKTLRNENDLTSITDEKLLSTAKKIGLLTEIGYKRLDLIRYMRNNASAAHPSTEYVGGAELVSFLENCIKEVINVPVDEVTMNIRQLLGNLKKNALSDKDVNTAGVMFEKLPGERADTLANGLFGLYTSIDERTSVIADNVRKLWPKIWPYVRKETRYKYGIQQGTYVVNAEKERAGAALELFELVDNGKAYLSHDVRIAQINDALSILQDAHRGIDNFYNEPLPARNLLSLINNEEDVAESLRYRYVSTVVECFLGNSFGVSNAAVETYETILSRFSTKDANIAIRLFTQDDFSIQLSSAVGREQWKKLLQILKPKFVNAVDLELWQAVQDFNGTPDKLKQDSNIKRLLKS